MTTPVNSVVCVELNADTNKWFELTNDSRQLTGSFKTKNDMSQGPISDNPAWQFPNAGLIEIIRIK